MEDGEELAKRIHCRRREKPEAGAAELSSRLEESAARIEDPASKAAARLQDHLFAVRGGDGVTALNHDLQTTMFGGDYAQGPTVVRRRSYTWEDDARVERPVSRAGATRSATIGAGRRPNRTSLTRGMRARDERRNDSEQPSGRNQQDQGVGRNVEPVSVGSRKSRQTVSYSRPRRNGDFRDPAKRFPITVLQKASSKRHAIPCCERTAEPLTAEAEEPENSRRWTPPPGP